MKALVYRGPREVAVEDVADPRIEDPKDAVVRITTTNICGSDLHMYEGRTDVETGKILGHENMGVVEAVGDAVERIRVGDRVSLPFNIACGTGCGVNLQDIDAVAGEHRVDRRGELRIAVTRCWEGPFGAVDPFEAPSELTGEGHVGDDPAALILGDNIFHGPGFSTPLQRAHAVGEETLLVAVSEAAEPDG